MHPTLAAEERTKNMSNTQSFCWSRGPRLGNAAPVCFKAAGHARGRHRAHPDAGFGDVRWTDPAMVVPVGARDDFWRPAKPLPDDGE